MPTLKQIAYLHIRGKLAADLLPGDRLSPKTLAKEIGMSHTPVREALNQLQSDGLIVEMPQRGMFVRQPDREELVEIIELRTILETHAASEAARRIREAELDELEQHCEDLRELAEAFAKLSPSEAVPLLSQWMVADLAFHMTILSVGGNSQVSKVINDMRILTRMFGFRADDPAGWSDVPRYFAENYRVHLDLYSAIRRRDPKTARRAMRAHMAAARRSLLARFDWLPRKHDVDDPLATELPKSVRDHIRAIEQPHEQE